jgi:hypothetical protein
VRERRREKNGKTMSMSSTRLFGGRTTTTRRKEKKMNAEMKYKEKKRE